MDIRELARDEYPASLREIPEPPERLWVAGKMPSTGTKLLAVVGSRALTSYGREACAKLVGGLAGYPISIVSGLALGADAAAHRAALAAGLHTIAVPGSGLDESVLYPQSNVGLAKEILKSGGALLSEQEPTHKPWLKEFPSRNRIMVGMSQAVLMIEAGEKSGTLITARLTAEYNRDLLCVPHRIGDVHGFGSHLFLRLGATLVTHPLHILEALAIPPRLDGEAAPAIRLEGNEKLLYELIAEPKSRDDLVRLSKLSVGDALTALVTLELKGLAREEFGAWRRI
ncbi:MAG: protecting protein DprA [Parcubacteria group bacterium]|nr:protecting protein DprA [Parcubacteria group bacterium]